MNWQIEYMTTTPSTANPPECVMVAGWRCVGTQTVNGKTHTASQYGTAGFQAPGDPFTPYANLTQDQVLGWVWASGVDKAGVEASIQRELDDKVNPPMINPPLPW